jgi:DNA-nicking Smr family endonuclease
VTREPTKSASSRSRASKDKPRDQTAGATPVSGSTITGPTITGPSVAGLKGLSGLKRKLVNREAATQRAPAPPSPASKSTRTSALNEDEQDVWDYVAESVTPLDVPQHVPMFDHLIELYDGSSSATSAVDPNRNRQRTKSTPASPILSSTSLKVAPKAAPLATKPSPPALGDFEPRKAKRIGRGHIEIDARLDLHGDYQDEAHRRLRAFLTQCFHEGRRTVLVITGKGRDVENDAAADAFNLGYERREKGVLRRNVPRWLAEPDLRAIVVSYTTAHVRHGGEGALYVQLRRHR